ncbi:hypothetical protein NT06LI_1859, partial [Listeria innocua FSL J1-023]
MILPLFSLVLFQTGIRKSFADLILTGMRPFASFLPF